MASISKPDVLPVFEHILRVSYAPKMAVGSSSVIEIKEKWDSRSSPLRLSPIIGECPGGGRGIGESLLNFHHLFGESLVNFRQYWRQSGGFSPILVQNILKAINARTNVLYCKMYRDACTWDIFEYHHINF